jgi:hypothetical protein
VQNIHQIPKTEKFKVNPNDMTEDNRENPILFLENIQQSHEELQKRL